MKRFGQRGRSKSAMVDLVERTRRPSRGPPLRSLQHPDAEVVLALVAPLGTDHDQLQAYLTKLLSEFNYTCNAVRLSELIDFLEPTPATERHANRIRKLMDGGTALRTELQRGDALVMRAVEQIAALRGDGDPTPLPRTAHVLRSLKHPDEARALRQIYGPGFFLIAAYASEKERRRFLMHERNVAKDEADELLRRDKSEPDDFGQQTSNTFHLADAFVRMGRSTKVELSRVLDLIFGSPLITPTRDEMGMQLAFSWALRSGDLSRQVGAAILDEHGDVVAVGANDAPTARRGQYWPGEGEDHRDLAKGTDENENWKRSAALDVANRLGFMADAAPELREKQLLAALKGSPLLDITEFGRAVHAEMEALLACARSGRSPRGGTLYCTTFPCHNCAKHIVDAGISRVVYVEPYPKSRALDLHGDAVRFETRRKSEAHVLFEPFVGVGPRRFFDLFSLELGRGRRLKRKEGGGVVAWSRGDAQPRLAMSPHAYLTREALAVAEFAQRFYP